MESREGTVSQSGGIQGSDLTRAEIDTAFQGLSGADWKRALRLAAFAARGLPGKTGEDLLHDTIVQLLTGDRRFPRGVHPLVVLKTAMRSNASNTRKVELRGPIRPGVAVAGHSMVTEAGGVEGQDRRTPLAALEAEDLLRAIEAEVAKDDALSMVAMAWCDGLRGAEAADLAGLTAKEYDAVRKKLLRRLGPHAADRSDQ